MGAPRDGGAHQVADTHAVDKTHHNSRPGHVAGGRSTRPALRPVPDTPAEDAGVELGRWYLSALLGADPQDIERLRPLVLPCDLAHPTAGRLLGVVNDLAELGVHPALVLVEAEVSRRGWYGEPGTGREVKAELLELTTCCPITPGQLPSVGAAVVAAALRRASLLGGADIAERTGSCAEDDVLPCWLHHGTTVRGIHKRLQHLRAMTGAAQ